MPKIRHTIMNQPVKEIRPALSAEAREVQLISLAERLVEQRLLDGTASSQEVTHYLKLGAEREKRDLEMQKLRNENELLVAKVDSLKAAARSEELFEEAIRAFSSYRPSEGGMEDGENSEEY